MVKRGLIIFILLASTAATVYLYTSQHSSRRETEASMIEFSPVEPGAMGVDERLDDFEHFYRFIEANYPYIELKERTHGVKWLDLREGFEARIRDAADNEEFLQVIMEAVTALQNRHTRVMAPEEVREYRARFSESYPMNAVFCDEVTEAAEYWTGIYDRVTHRKHYTAYDDRIVYDRGNYILADYYGKPTMGEGSRITKVNSEPMDDAVKTCFTRDYLDWDFTREKLYLWRIAPTTSAGTRCSPWWTPRDTRQTSRSA